MLRPASFKSVWQQEHNAAQAAPFVFGAGDELIDDHLRGVPEIAKLSFPPDQPFGAIEAVAVLEAQHAVF